MLTHLHVKNLALIEETEVDFAEGLNILTGETGAGKSIIIGSINLALGQRVSREMIRDEQQPALVELVFEVEDACKETLERLDIPMEDNQVIISRRITGTRSVSKINGETVPVALLKQAAELLIDIHGQHEHQSLLKKEKHLEILDAFARVDIEKSLKEVEACHKAFFDLKKKLEEFTTDDSSREREIAFLQYEIQEIDNANLKVGEDEQLEQDYRKMQNGKKIAESLNMAYQLTSGSGGVDLVQQLGRAAMELGAVADYDEGLQELLSQVQDIEMLLNDFNRDVSAYMQDFEFSEEDFRETEERLDVINHLKSKYGNTIEDIFKYKEEQEEKLRRLTDYELTLSNMCSQLKEQEKALKKACEAVTSIRKKYAKKLTEQIKAALIDLNFLDVQFEIELARTSQYHGNGWDEVEFLISTNPGEPVRSLGRVASGGELSRIMLAIKTILADKDQIDTLIFDEIDVGISGRTAQKVSEKMAVIAKSRQVICITHLAQIAAMADVHFAIEKSANSQGTTTKIRQLDSNEMVEELARILGGAQITEAVRLNAKEMKELARQSKI